MNYALSFLGLIAWAAGVACLLAGMPVRGVSLLLMGSALGAAAAARVAWRADSGPRDYADRY
jgi:hypothetical protein